MNFDFTEKTVLFLMLAIPLILAACVWMCVNPVGFWQMIVMVIVSIILYVIFFIAVLILAVIIMEIR